MKIITEIPQEWKNISDLFIALGDEQRQRILLAFGKEERLNILQIVASSKLRAHSCYASFKNIA